MTKKHTLRHAIATASDAAFAVPVLALLLAAQACGGAAGGDPSGVSEPGRAPPPSATADGDGDGASAGEPTAAQPEPLKLTARGRTFLDEIEREARSLDPLSSFYSHTTVMNEATNTRQTDCSGFVDYALGRVLPDALVGVTSDAAKGRPLADDWYRFLAARPAAPTTDPSRVWWRRVAHPVNLVAGDVIAWLRPPSVESDNTGHVMVVTGPPRAGRDHELIVPITDATASEHANDTRGATRTGIGSGEIGLQLDAQGEARAYYWKGGQSPTAYVTKIALGHLE